MAVVNPMRVTAGIRVGFWKPKVGGFRKSSPFEVKGIYTGPDIGDLIPGQRISQTLDEGQLDCRVGVLFRPDLGKRQKLETILILETYIPEMFDYEHWEAV